MRYIGERREDGSYSGTFPTILALVGLHPKFIVCSGETDPEVLEHFGGTVLGHEWRPEPDTLVFKLKVNLSSKNRKGIREDPDLTVS